MTFGRIAGIGHVPMRNVLLMAGLKALGVFPCGMYYGELKALVTSVGARVTTRAPLAEQSERLCEELEVGHIVAVPSSRPDYPYFVLQVTKGLHTVGADGETGHRSTTEFEGTLVITCTYFEGYGNAEDNYTKDAPRLDSPMYSHFV